jgi:hypothetical protein
MAMAIATIFYGIYLAVMALPRKKPVEAAALELGGLAVAVLLAIVFITFAAHVLFSGGLQNVLASRYDRLALQADETSSTAAALSTATTGIMTMGTILIAACLQRKAPLTAIGFLIALAMLLVLANPFNTSRFALLETYVPLAFIACRGRVPSAAFYALAMFGIVILFPILNITTRYGLSGFGQRGAGELGDALTLRFVDTFDMLTECVTYVSRHGFSYGTKLFADLVVLVPRSWWPGKPLLGGLDVGGEVLYYHIFGTANVSQIVAADGYMDFGLAGVLLVGVVIGFVVRWLLSKRVFINGHDLFAYIFISALPILIRGPLAAVIMVFLFQMITLAMTRRYLARPLHSGTLLVRGLGGTIDRWSYTNLH